MGLDNLLSTNRATPVTPTILLGVTDEAPFRATVTPVTSVTHEKYRYVDFFLDAARRIVWIEANRAGLNPSDVWAWLDISDLEWIGSGQRESVRALRAFCRYWSVFGSQTTGGHSIPFETKNSKR